MYVYWRDIFLEFLAFCICIAQQLTMHGWMGGALVCGRCHPHESIDVALLQETHIATNSVEIKRGFTFYFSGNNTSNSEFYGVGIVIANKIDLDPRTTKRSYKYIEDLKVPFSTGEFFNLLFSHLPG